MNKDLLILSLLISSVASTVAAQNNTAISANGVEEICPVGTDPKTFDNKEIVVDALYRFTPHGALLTGRNCPEFFVALKDTDTYKADPLAAKEMRRFLRKDRYAPIEIVVRGRFHVAHQGQCFGGENCARYQLEISQLISANGVPKESRPSAQ